MLLDFSQKEHHCCGCCRRKCRIHVQGAPRIFCICNTSSRAIPSWVTSSHLQLGQLSLKNISLLSLQFSKQIGSRLGWLPPAPAARPPRRAGTGGCRAACGDAVPAVMPRLPLNQRWKNHSLRSLGSQSASPSSLRRKQGYPSASPTCPSIGQQRGRDAGMHLLPPGAASMREKQGSKQIKKQVEMAPRSSWCWLTLLCRFHSGFKGLEISICLFLFFFFLLPLEAAQLPCDEDGPADVRPRASPALAPRSFPAGLGFPLLAPVTLPVPTAAGRAAATRRGHHQPRGGWTCSRRGQAPH